MSGKSGTADDVNPSRRQRVLFVGLGAMGAPMARNLVRAPTVELTVADADPERVSALAGGRIRAGSLVQDLPGADVLLLMVPSSDIVEQILVADGGLEGLRPGGCVLDMGSSRPSSTAQLARRAADRGLAYVDAPVSGGVGKAASAELTIMAGGDDSAVDRVRPILDALGTTVMRTGPVGSGHAVKALNNLLSAIGLAGAAEVLSVAARFGLDPATVLGVINASSGRNHATETKFASCVLSGTFDYGFALQLMVKDLRTALDLAAETATPTPIAALVVDAAQATLDSPGAAGADHTFLAGWIAARAGTDLHAATGRATIAEAGTNDRD
jgi:3-hydroxyisobutyrate dehydrogenase